MPFKTRRQKIAASQRKYSFTEGGVENSYGLNQRQEIPEKRDNISKMKTIDDTLFLRRDILKIVAISATIVAVQIGLRLTLS